MSRLRLLMPIAAFGIAFSMPGAAIAADELGSWTVEQLCDARDDPEALDELERREVFDGRELRAIRRDEMRKDIGEDALRCMKGAPETILPAITTVEAAPVDAFVYPPGTVGSLIVYVRREGDASTVIAFTESAVPYVTPLWGSESYLYGGGVCPGQAICVPATGAIDQHRMAVSRAQGMTASTPSLPSQ